MWSSFFSFLIWIFFYFSKKTLIDFCSPLKKIFSFKLETWNLEFGIESLKLGIESFKIFLLKKNGIFVLDHLPKKKKKKNSLKSWNFFLQLISSIFFFLKHWKIFIHSCWFFFFLKRKKKDFFFFFWELTESTQSNLSWLSNSGCKIKKGAEFWPPFLVFSPFFCFYLFFLPSSSIVTIHFLLPLGFSPSLHHFFSKRITFLNFSTFLHSSPSISFQILVF